MELVLGALFLLLNKSYIILYLYPADKISVPWFNISVRFFIVLVSDYIFIGKFAGDSYSIFLSRDVSKINSRFSYFYCFVFSSLSTDCGFFWIGFITLFREIFIWFTGIFWDGICRISFFWSWTSLRKLCSLGFRHEVLERC